MIRDDAYQSAADHFSYDPKTGIITRKSDAGPRYKSGSIAINIMPNGHVRTMHHGRALKLNRLAWILHFSSIPKGVIENIDGDYTNNRIANLRIKSDPLKREITSSLVRELFSYDEDAGCLTRKVAIGHFSAGSQFGGLTRSGYMQGMINYRQCLVHRIVWLHVHGEWPPHTIDHINGIKSDNRICNLRLATTSENSCNTGQKKPRIKAPYKGIFSTKHGKWRARVSKNGIHYNLGYHETPEAAHADYLDWAKRLHGDFYHHD